MGWIRWQRDRQEAAAARHVAEELAPGEEVEVAFNGFLGTSSGSLPSTAGPGLYVNPAGAFDGYEVVLTSHRLLALRVKGPSRRRAPIAFACDRAAAQCAVVRRRPLYDRVQLGFPGGSLSLTVHRMFRGEVDRVADALRR